MSSVKNHQDENDIQTTRHWTKWTHVGQTKHDMKDKNDIVRQDIESNQADMTKDKNKT